ncbi:MAG: MoxR family ATPase [Thermoprotei archaeon]|nr:MAG: MoxR family ATPase [Thermoprotei archaeon]
MQKILEMPSLFVKELERPFVGRYEEAKLIALALLTREHAILIGEPGTAKSAMIRRAAQLVGARFFSYLMTKFTEPSELFGPLDINALKEGRYVRITKGKLPEADIVFLDEIFKASSAILNALLSILNERVFFDGYTEIVVPLWSLFSATNEVPEDPELEALYDRILLRQYVRPLSDNMWKDLLEAAWAIEIGKVGVPQPVMTLEELKRLYDLVLQVDLSPIKSKLLKLFAVLESKGIHLTDRRKAKCLKAVAAHAILNGRLKAVEEDLIVIKNIAPHDIEEFEKVSIILSEELKTPYKYLRELEEIKASVREIENYIASFPRIDSRFIVYRLTEIYRDLETTRERVLAMVSESSNEQVEREATDVIALIDRVMGRIRERLS